MGFSIQQLYRNHIVLLCAILVPLLTGSLLFATAAERKAAVAHELQTQATMIAVGLWDKGVASTAELNALLKPATVNPSLKLACIVSAEGAVRASVYGNALETVDKEVANCEATSLAQIEKSNILVRVPITNPSLPQSSGDVVLVVMEPNVMAALVRCLLFAVAACIVVGLLNWMLGLELERILLTPIRQIATTAQRVSLYKDYSLRVVIGTLSVVPKEIDALTESFNAMLHEIEDRDTRLTRKSAELEKSRHAAVVASQAKSQFLANVSHELRTPLNAIIGFSTMLESEQFGPMGHPKYTEYAHDIHESGRHLLDVINDILDLSKAETGTLSIKFEQLNLSKIIEKTLNIISGQALERKIDIYTDLPEKLPKIYADRVRLVQILLNLLSNAIKFSNEGSKVVIRASAEAAKNGVHYFVIEIQDTGIGMSQEDVAKAFLTFNQSDSGLNRKYEGAGLGLPLTKRLVELHHGKIKVESELGKGTLVTVRLTSDPALLE
jgi:signal transduction histidine kinase